MRNLFLALVPVLTLVGCSVHAVDPLSAAPQPAEPSTKYETADIAASFSAQSEGDHVRLYAALIVKGGAFLELSASDTLTGTVGSETHPLLVVKDGDAVHYEADFAQPATAVPATISFTRGDGKRGGDSSVMVPAPFTMAVTPSGSVSHAGALALAVPGFGTTTSDALDVDVTGVCVKNGKISLDVSVAAEAARLDMTKVTLADTAVAECDLELSVQSRAEGRVDPAFKDDLLVTSFEAVQRRVVTTHMTK